MPRTRASNPNPLPGEIWGAAPGTFTLYRGLPGFQIVGYLDTTNKLVGVIAAPDATCLCVAKESSHYGRVSCLDTIGSVGLPVIR